MEAMGPKSGIKKMAVMPTHGPKIRITLECKMEAIPKLMGPKSVCNARWKSYYYPNSWAQNQELMQDGRHIKYAWAQNHELGRQDGRHNTTQTNGEEKIQCHIMSLTSSGLRTPLQHLINFFASWPSVIE